MRRFLLALFESVLNVLIVIALVIGGGWYVFIRLPEDRGRADDPAYAPAFFEGLVPVTAYLESLRSLRDADEFDCSYAIAELGPDAPLKPPTRNPGELGEEFAFAGEWMPTPGQPLESGARDVLASCEANWTTETRIRMRAAATQPGGWIARRPGGETLLLYSNPERIIARVRFGN